MWSLYAEKLRLLANRLEEVGAEEFPPHMMSGRFSRNITSRGADDAGGYYPIVIPSIFYRYCLSLYHLVINHGLLQKKNHSVNLFPSYTPQISADFVGLLSQPRYTRGYQPIHEYFMNTYPTNIPFNQHYKDYNVPC